MGENYQWVEVKKVRRVQGTNPFLRLDTFFVFQFENTSNLIFLGFKVSSERFFHKFFKIGLTF